MTKRRIVFIVSLLISLLFVLLVGGTIPYFIFYIFLLTFLIPLIHSLLIFKNIKGFMETPKGLFYVGEKIPLQYYIENNSVFYIPAIKIRSNIAKELSGTMDKEVLINLNPKSSFIHREDLILKRRGYYEIGQVEVSIKDVFGIFTLKKTISSEVSILVYPDPIDLNLFEVSPVSQLGDLLMDDPVFQDRSRVSSLRDYREGDSIKSIHWKLWAKSDDLVVKDYESRGDTGVVVFVDNYKGNYKDDVDRRLEDKLVDVSLSIINYHLDRNILVFLETQDYEKQIKIQGQKSSHIKPFLDALAKFKPNGRVEFKNFLLDGTKFSKIDSTIIIVTPNLNKSIGGLGILLKTKNLDPLFIAVHDSKNKTGFLDIAVESKLRKENIPVYILDCTSNIKETLEG